MYRRVPAPCPPSLSAKALAEEEACQAWWPGSSRRSFSLRSFGASSDFVGAMADTVSEGGGTQYICAPRTGDKHLANTKHNT
jgi:hypothetical protein